MVNGFGRSSFNSQLWELFKFRAVSSIFLLFYVTQLLHKGLRCGSLPCRTVGFRVRIVGLRVVRF